MKNETTAELLPCPFCGSEASLTQIESAGGDGRMIWIVGCEECEVAFRGHARKVDAAKDWNTRTPTSQIAVLRTALERDSNSQSVVAEFHPRFHALAATPADPVREAATALVEKLTAECDGFARCPKCHGAASLYNVPEDDEYVYAECHNGCFKSRPYRSKERATEEWNNRFGIKAELTALKTALEAK